MSKKSRRRNRNLLKMASLAGLGLALANRGKGTEMANIMPEGGGKDAATMKIPKGVEMLERNVDVPVSVPLGRMRGAGSDADAIAGQMKRAAYAQRMRNAVTGVDGPPSELINPFGTRVYGGRRGSTSFKKGGKVKKANKMRKK